MRHGALEMTSGVQEMRCCQGSFGAKISNLMLCRASRLNKESYEGWPPGVLVMVVLCCVPFRFS